MSGRAFDQESEQLVAVLEQTTPDALAVGMARVRRQQQVVETIQNALVGLDDPDIPADNNGTERDIRSLAAARSDGGTHRADWSATAFANIKSVVVTGMKNGLRFIRYGIDVVRAKLRGERLPLPLVPNTS